MMLRIDVSGEDKKKSMVVGKPKRPSKGPEQGRLHARPQSVDDIDNLEPKGELGG